MSQVSELKQKQSAATSAVQSGPSFRIGDAMNYKAWVAKAAKQPMVLETVDLRPLGAEDVEVAVDTLRFVSLRSLRPKQ
jgi:hypothetical protein